MSKTTDFDFYIEKKIVRKVSSNPIRAKDMIQKADKSLVFLKEIREKIGINNNNANDIITHCYNILMELVRAKLLKEGYKSSGNAAHEAEVSYMLKMGFSEKETEFLNELRSSRNKIMYYDNSFDEEYAKKVIEFLDSIYPRLKKIAESG